MPSGRLEPGLREPPDNIVPEGWRKCRLREAATFCGGGRLGLTKEKDYRSAGFPAFSAAGQDGCVSVWEFDRDAVVIPSIGSIGRAYRAEGRWTALANTQVVFPDPKYLRHSFLHHRVDDTDYWPVSGTAQPFIKPSDLPKCWIMLPPTSEQVRIAAILDTLDKVIRRTEQVIAKLQRVTQGLLHDLMTRGLDENGQLRPPPNEAPQFYKDSPLRLIPRAWGITSIGTLFDIESGEAPRSLRCEDGPFPLMGANGEIGRCRSANFGPGYVIGRVGAAGAITKVRKRVWASDNTLTATPGPTTDFDLGYFLLLAARPSDLATKSAQPLITQANLRLLLTVLIPEREQKALSKLLGQAEGRLRLEEDLVNKYRTIRRGLLNDLLTGRVRVPMPAEVPA